MSQHSEVSQDVREGEHDASARVARMRAALLGGRGPGASAQEIAEHTRDRTLLGAVPAPTERALVARQAGRLRAGEPITKRSARISIRHDRRRAALSGAAAALLTRWLVHRLIRSRTSPPR
ncbi:MAG: hypothetical protein M3Z75_14915 [Actinomycetota bacterium]|nr:hypothetical protein [Actinomycetota bacterium]